MHYLLMEAREECIPDLLSKKTSEKTSEKNEKVDRNACSS